MSDLQRLIQREFASKEAIRIVTVIGDRRMLEFSPTTTAPVWVTDVELGGGKPLRNIPIKSINGSMFYAQRGQTVQIRKNALGRWQIVGPGDRLATTLVTKEYDLGSGSQVGNDINQGFTFQRQPYEFYQGPTSMKGDPGPVTFVANGGGDDQIVRTSGSWLDDGFEVSDTVVVSRTLDNDSVSYTVTAVAALTLDISGNVLTAEVADGLEIGIGVAGTSLWNNGGPFPGYPEVTLVDQDGNPV